MLRVPSRFDAAGAKLAAGARLRGEASGRSTVERVSRYAVFRELVHEVDAPTASALDDR